MTILSLLIFSASKSNGLQLKPKRKLYLGAFLLKALKKAV
ncbi:hypothetical protein EBME_2178 [bacterium endosymbiont of Mortierella elongata FMR23-6]|nr:hypothetical protein EBME_2178 [bacterium endosymbiont of Mortierella elongata FMR23-6]